MKYKLLNKREVGERVLHDSITIEGKTYKHFQMEERNGRIFMRSKVRKLSSSTVAE